MNKKAQGLTMGQLVFAILGAIVILVSSYGIANAGQIGISTGNCESVGGICDLNAYNAQGTCDQARGYYPMAVNACKFQGEKTTGLLGDRSGYLQKVQKKPCCYKDDRRQAPPTPGTDGSSGRETGENEEPPTGIEIGAGEEETDGDEEELAPPTGISQEDLDEYFKIRRRILTLKKYIELSEDPEEQYKFKEELAIRYSELGFEQKATEVMEDIGNNHPDIGRRAATQHQLATMYATEDYELYDPNLAISHFEEFEERYPEEVGETDVFFQLFRLYAKQGNIGKISEYYRNIESETPDYLPQVAEVLAEKEDEEVFTERMEDAVKKQRDIMATTTDPEKRSAAEKELTSLRKILVRHLRSNIEAEDGAES